MSEQVPDTNQLTTLFWDLGTAYELSVSMQVLFKPENFGLRPSWAAGVRSRIPAPERKFLEDITTFFYVPLRMKWIYSLPEPKDALSALWTLRQISPDKRFSTIWDFESWDEKEKPFASILIRVAEQRAWDKKDLAACAKNKFESGHASEEQIARFLDWWAKPEECGEMLLTSIQSYYQVFFMEEEKRLLPILKASLEHAKELARQLNTHDLLVELSQGLHFEKMEFNELVIIPDYWFSPLIMQECVSKDRCLFLYGSRPATMSVIPGELVPEGLMRALKALADPTRLKILFYLNQEELNPSELARRLNLRAPTVTHHLHELRLSGLVNLTIQGQEKRYRLRSEALNELQDTFKAFFGKELDEASSK
jgi:DNA-binding transcriptional ArsR family regulator